KKKRGNGQGQRRRPGRRRGGGTGTARCVPLGLLPDSGGDSVGGSSAPRSMVGTARCAVRSRMELWGVPAANADQTKRRLTETPYKLGRGSATSGWPSVAA